MAGCKNDKEWKPPEVIYLQREDEEGNLAGSHNSHFEIYWCDEKIYKSDVKYRRVDGEEELGTD